LFGICVSRLEWWANGVVGKAGHSPLALETGLRKISNPPSSTSKGDIVHVGIKAAVGMVPFAGSVLSETFQAAVSSPAEKRHANWMAELTDAVNELLDRCEELTPEQLGQNEVFLTTVIAATQSAMLTERLEKLQILKAVVLQAGSGTVLSEVVRNTFLELVGRYTPEHVNMLQHLDNQTSLRQAFNRVSKSDPKLIHTSSEEKSVKIEDLAPYLLPELLNEIASEIFTDLHRDRLCRGSEGFSCPYQPTMETPITTKRGKEFLKFVSQD